MKRPKLEISRSEINPNSIEVAIKNAGKSIAVGCYVRITLEKINEDVISEPKKAFITKRDPSVKIYEDYVAWSLSPNPVRINIPPLLSDRALIGNIFGLCNNKKALEVASEVAFTTPRVILEANK